MRTEQGIVLLSSHVVETGAVCGSSTGATGGERRVCVVDSSSRGEGQTARAIERERKLGPPAPRESLVWFGRVRAQCTFKIV